MKRLLLSLLTIASCAGSAVAVVVPELPEAPENGIRDNAHAIDDATETRMAAEMARFHQEFDGRLWITAVTFPPDGQTLRQHARELRQHWSGDEPAVVLAYDRVSDGQALSFAPGLWERYSTTDLVMLMHQGALIMTDKALPLEQRLEKSAALTMSRLREMERRSAQMQVVMSPPHQRFATVAGGALCAGAVGMLFLCGISRRRDRHASWQLLFPEVQVSPRFGAPYGGGVVVSSRSRQP